MPGTEKSLETIPPYLKGINVPLDFSKKVDLSNCRILMIDNFDSFTYNLVHYLKLLKAQIQVERNDFSELLNEDFVDEFDFIVLSPGPMNPHQSGRLVEFIQKFDQLKPILGICLGMQALGICNGAQLLQAPIPRHGKTSKIITSPHAVFKEMKIAFFAMRYHSLALNFSNTDQWDVIAHSEDQVPMIAVHKFKTLAGIQFHPESILTEYGFVLLANMIDFLMNRHSCKLSGCVLRI